MTLSERRYYRIATGLSIMLHTALLLCALPKLGWFGPFNQIEMISAGIVEINPGAPAKAPDVVSSKRLPTVAAAPKTDEKIIASKPKKISPVEPKKQPPKEAGVKKNKVTAKEKVTKKQPVKPVEKLPDQKQVKPKEQPPQQPVAKPKETPKKQLDQNVKESARPDPKTTLKTASDPAKQKTGKADTQNAPKDENGKPEASGGKTPVVQKLGSGKNLIASGLDVPFYYPKNARNEEIEGDVQLKLLLGTDGALEEIYLVKSAGDARLDRAAQNYIRRNYKYQPHEEKYYIDLIVSFKISNEAPNIKFLNAETRF
jgi:protein TonB